MKHKVMKSKRTLKISKICPKCEHKMPTACKNCSSCGHAFKPPLPPRPPRGIAGDVGLTDDQKPGTRRRKRERPDYYNTVKYDQQFRRQKRSTSQSSVGDETVRRKRGRPKGAKSQVKIQNKAILENTKDIVSSSSTENSSSCKDEDVYAGVMADRAMQLSVILQEINRKYATQNFKPP